MKEKRFFFFFSFSFLSVFFIFLLQTLLTQLMDRILDGSGMVFLKNTQVFLSFFPFLSFLSFFLSFFLFFFSGEGDCWGTL